LRATNPADSGRYDNLFVFACTLLCPIQQSKKMENDGGAVQVAAMDELRQSAVCLLSPSSSLPIGLPSGGGGYVVPSSASCTGRYDNLFIFACTLLCPIQQSKKMENDGGTAQVAAMDELRQSAVCLLSPSSSLPIGLPSGGGGYVVPSSASCIYLLLNIILM
jgi:hypothetical protein